MRDADVERGEVDRGRQRRRVTGQAEHAGVQRRVRGEPESAEQEDRADRHHRDRTAVIASTPDRTISPRDPDDKVRNGSASAYRPPRVIPINEPTPYRARTPGTALGRQAGRLGQQGSEVAEDHQDRGGHQRGRGVRQPEPRVAPSRGARRRAAARSAGSGRPAGIVARTPAIASTTCPATVQNAARQPRCWPITVPAGRPTMVAIVRPPVTTLIARARRFAGTSPTAVTAATAQNPAYTKAPTIRVASSTS